MKAFYLGANIHKEALDIISASDNVKKVAHIF